MKVTLIYFNFPFWRAEMARISLFIGNIDFQDLRINSDEFQRVKSKGHLDSGIKVPFHQLPCLVVDKVSIVQSAGIGRYCGKLAGLYPINDAIQAALIDQYIDILTDITEIVSSTKIESRDEIFQGILSRKLYILNKNIDQNSDYLVNNTLTIADIGIWSLMDWLISGKVDGVPLDILQDHNKITNVCKIVAGNTKVNEWINKTYPQNYRRVKY